MDVNFAQNRTQTPMAEINMIPLIDVMLVLLVIFIITAPLLTHSVKIDLPKASSTPNLTKRENIQLALRANGDVFWNGNAISIDALNERFVTAAQVEPQPEIHIRADAKVEYGTVAQAMSLAAKAGLTRIGFVTDPSLEEK
ncbi:MAG: ExbD/TolR family protein [Burkholderiales bacterium]